MGQNGRFPLCLLVLAREPHISGSKMVLWAQEVWVLVNLFSHPSAPRGDNLDNANIGSEWAQTGRNRHFCLFLTPAAAHQDKHRSKSVETPRQLLRVVWSLRGWLLVHLASKTRYVFVE